MLRLVGHQSALNKHELRKSGTLYSHKQLTFSKDVLPAPSGVANRVRNAGRHYAGNMGELHGGRIFCGFSTHGDATQEDDKT
jgi:hypothetical protein